MKINKKKSCDLPIDSEPTSAGTSQAQTIPSPTCFNDLNAVGAESQQICPHWLTDRYPTQIVALPILFDLLIWPLMLSDSLYCSVDTYKKKNEK